MDYRPTSHQWDAVQTPYWRADGEYCDDLSMYRSERDYVGSDIYGPFSDYYQGPFSSMNNAGTGFRYHRYSGIPWEGESDGGMRETREIRRRPRRNMGDRGSARPHSREPEYGVLDVSRPEQAQYTVWGNGAYDGRNCARSLGHRIDWSPETFQGWGSDN